MKNVFVYTYGLLFLIVLAFAVMLGILIHQLTGASLLILIPVMVVLSALIALVIFKVLMSKEKRDPMAKLHQEYMNEFRVNGVSEKMLSMADQAINEHVNVKPIGITYFKDFVLLPADHFNMIGDFDRAMKYLQLIDENEIRSKSIMFIDNGLSVLTYFTVKIYTLYSLKDCEGVKKIYDEAKNIFEKPDKKDFQAVILDSLEFYYLLSVCEYEKAKEIADRMLKYDNKFAEYYPTKYAINAELDLLLGEKEKAAEFMRTCLEKTEKIAPVLKPEYECLIKRWGLEL